MKGLEADIRTCTGCQLCALVCSGTHTGKFNPSESRICVEDLFPEPAEVRLRYCIQCDDHPCVEACPAEAVKLDEKNGVYYVDREACDACGACVEACPHDGCWLDPTGSYAIKCDLCGGTPQCVDVCPKHVLKAGE